MSSKSKKKSRKTQRPKTEKCAGCNGWYTINGYFHHLRQTSKPACIAIRDSDEHYRASGSDANSTRSSQSTGAEPQQFEGDYFGEYQPGDCDDFDDYNADADENPEPDGDDDEVAEEAEAEEADTLNFQEEGSWEEPPPQDDDDAIAMDVDDEGLVEDRSTEALDLRTAQHRAQEQLCTKTFVNRFPDPRAGAPLLTKESSAYDNYQTELDPEGENPYRPFTSRLDWEIARWAKMRGPGSSAVTELLAIKGVNARASFKNSRELDMIIDNNLSSGRPRFIRREIKVAGEIFEVFYRDVIQCIRALYGDPEFAGILVFTPERHYADPDHTIRVYFDMHTGRWWWETQKSLEQRNPGATIIPIIISSDKTQLTVFRSKTAYPVYMTIGNLPKDVRRKPSRRGQILLAYLPSSRLEHITNKAARRRVTGNLFHACLSAILKPLVVAGIHGIKIVSGDGVARRGHPIFAMYIGDYPEQLLVTCCKNGTCPKCNIPRTELGDATDLNRPLRNFTKVLAALGEVENTATAFSRACREAGIKPIHHPFWEKLPYVNVFLSITPDILHQLHQGVVKHVLSWLKAAYGADELDARCRRLPPNHQIRLFLKGFTTLQRVTGKEYAQICRFLLGLVAGLPLRGGFSPARLVRALRAILDFLYLAQYPAHTSETLGQLHAALQRFHANKSIFVDLDIRQHFHFPKLHSLDHYPNSIKLFGTTDNYDTQYTERLHIDFAKEAYRATNHKDEFPQMTLWLERREKILRHEAYIAWRLRPENGGGGSEHRSPLSSTPPTSPGPVNASIPLPPPLPAGSPPQPTLTQIKITKWPTVKALRFSSAVEDYCATSLEDALARFIVKYRNPALTPPQIKRAAQDINFCFDRVPAYHRIKFILEDAQRLGIMKGIHDAAHARPARKDRQGRAVPARFDTVLVNEGAGGPTGVKGYRVGRVRLIFTLPCRACKDLLPDVIAPGPLAYIEWYTPFKDPDRIHGMYKVSHARNARNEHLADIVEVRMIRRSCHLIPAWGSTIVPRGHTSSTVLDNCKDFWVNPFSDQHMYMTLF
ncbi:hypothetical protein LXA43DRAFT_977924 [Ganoderma leucocontextum]|nr:hypothetical protein LXA43DRAFT_977924 [Ganoderma leucocontextum]